MSGAQRLRRLGPLIVMAAIFFTSNLPDTGSGSLVSLVPGTLKNLLHVPAYALLAASLCLALARRRGGSTALLVLVLTFSYGVFDEWHQSFVPGRDVSGADLLRDLLGAAIGVGLVRRWWAAQAVPGTDIPPTDGC